MKKFGVPLCILTLTMIFSCKKTDSGGNKAAAASYLSSVVTYSAGSRVIDSLTYDTLHRLVQFSQFDYDSTSGSPMYNTFSASFTYQDDNAATPPSTYTYADELLGNYGDKHILSFDGQGRIVKDTSLSGSGYVAFYSYPGNNLASTVLFEGTTQDNQVDTLFVSNGNVGEERVYISETPGQPDVLQGDILFGYSSTANPAYHAAITNAIGPLLTNFGIDGFGGNVDYNSRNVFNKISGAGPGVPIGFSANYTLTNDSKGRLSKMTVSAIGMSATTVFNYY